MIQAIAVVASAITLPPNGDERSRWSGAYVTKLGATAGGVGQRLQPEPPTCGMDFGPGRQAGPASSAERSERAQRANEWAILNARRRR